MGYRCRKENKKVLKTAIRCKGDRFSTGRLSDRGCGKALERGLEVAVSSGKNQILIKVIKWKKFSGSSGHEEMH